MNFYTYAPEDFSQKNEVECQSTLSTLMNTLLNYESLTFLKLENSLYTSFPLSDSDIAQSLELPSLKDSILALHHIKHNDCFYRFIRIDSFAPKSELNYLSNFNSYMISIQKFSLQESKTFLELKRRQFKSSLTQKIRDIEGEHAYQEAEETMENLLIHEDTLYHLEAHIILKARTLDELVSSTSDTIKNLSALNLKYVIENAAQGYILEKLSTTPQKLLIARPMAMSSLLNYLPLSNDILHTSGLALLGEFQKPIYFDLFDKNSLNFNAIVVGPPGSGKSFLVGNLIKHHVELGHHTLIIDRRGSYKRLVQYFDGVILDNSINPIISNDPHFLKELIVSQIPKGELTKKRTGELFNLLKSINTSKITNFISLLNEIDDDNITCYFAEILPLLSKNERIKHNKLIYIDLEDYPSTALPTLLIILIELFNNLPGPKILTLDECHFLLQNSANFVETRFRELRKKQGSAIAITQSFDDFTSTPLGLTITKCAFYKIFFKTDVKTSEFINNFDQFKINSLSTIKGVYSSFYIKSEYHKKNAYLITSSHTHDLLTTNYYEQSNILEKTSIKNTSSSFKERFDSHYETSKNEAQA